jgi:hypothetical protein
VAEQRADVVPAPALKKKRRRRKQRQAASGPPVGKLAPRAASMKEVSNGEARAAIAKRAAKEKAQLVAPTPGRCDAVKRTGELCGRPTEGTSCGYHGGKRMTKPPSKPRGDRLAVIRELAEARRPATPSAAEDAVLEDVSELEFE